MTSRPSKRDQHEVTLAIDAQLTAALAEYGIDGPKNVATRYDIQRLAHYVRASFGTPPNVLMLDWFIDEIACDIPSVIYQDIAEALALDARIEIAERL